MTGKGDSVSLRGLVYTLLLIHVYLRGTYSTPCTDWIRRDNFVHVNTMCGSATLQNTRLVIDSWDTGDPDVYSCTCTVTLDTGSRPSTYTTTVVVEEYPEMSPSQNCGSILTMNTTKSSIHTEATCTRVPAAPTYNFGISDMLTLTLSRTDVTTPWTSGHCILISQAQGSANLNLSVSCKDPQGKLNTPKPPPPPQITTTTTTSTTTTTTSTTTTTTTSTTTTTTTTPKTTTTERVTSTPVSQTQSSTVTSRPTSVSPIGDTATTGEQTENDVGIIAGAAGGGGLLLIIIIVVVIVIVIRKRRPNNNKPSYVGNRSYENGTRSFPDDIRASAASNKTYVNDNGDTLTHNSLYVSAGPRDPDNNHIITESGDVYAQVQKPDKRSAVTGPNTENIDLKESSGKDVYAVVNKSKPGCETVEGDDNRPSRYQNQDGLTYAEVSVQDRSSRPASRSTSRPPPVSPKPKVGSDNVLYAEVDTDIL